MAITNVSPDADIIIIQSPEIFHCENILEHTLQNLSNENYIINDGDRICQMIIAKYETVNFVEVDNLSDTERGTGGFGHTGKS